MIDRERQETYKKLKATVELLASGLNDMVRTHYVVCVVNRSEDLKDSIGAICTNVGWTNREGNRRPATIGQMTDLLIEAKLEIEATEVNEERWLEVSQTTKPH